MPVWERLKLEFWRQPEDVPPCLVGPWASCFTSLSPDFFLHPWPLERAGAGQVRGWGQVCKGQNRRGRAGRLRPGVII